MSISMLLQKISEVKAVKKWRMSDYKSQHPKRNITCQEITNGIVQMTINLTPAAEHIQRKKCLCSLKTQASG